MLQELCSWLGLTFFEIWINVLCFIVFTVLVTIKLHFPWTMKWSRVFIPFFTATALTLYLTIIICVRALFYKKAFCKTIIFKLLSTLSLFSLVFLLYYLTCTKLSEEADLSYQLIFIPVYFIFAILMIRACVCAH